MLDIITFGSATLDIFVRDKEFSFKKDKRLFTEKGVFFPLGTKIDIDELYFSSGGGGTNVAASFAQQGFKTAYCGMLGSDPAGEQIKKDIQDLKVDTGLISRTDKKPSNHSIVLSVPGKDRTILIYRGASELLSFNDIPWKKIKTRLRTGGWFYLAPMSGKLSKHFEKIVDFGFKNGIRIAVNPGNSQLELPKKKIEKILEKTNILNLNQEEAAFLTGIPYRKEKEIFKKIKSFYSGTFIMTKGTAGATVSDGKYIYEVGIMDSKVADRTGAGDSFSAGFVSGIMRKNNIEYALQLASANATSCLKKWGAKNGLLKKGQSFRKIKVRRNEI